MNRSKIALRYGLSIALWVFVLHTNYRAMQRSVLPTEDSLFLPPFALPAALIVLSASTLLALLFARSREAELFDATATVIVPMPWLTRLARVFMGATMLGSGVLSLIGRSRNDLPYSSPNWACFWIAFGALSLLSPSITRGNSVVVAPEGLRHPQIRPTHVAWEDVADIRLKRWLFSSFVIVTFRDGTNFRLSPLLWRWRKVKQLNCFPAYFGVSSETLIDALKMRRDLRAF